MTKEQLHLVDRLANSTSPYGVSLVYREAVRAILAERAELIDGCKIALGYAVKYCTVPDRDHELKPVVDILARANGGAT